MLGYDPNGGRKAEAMFPIRLKVRLSYEDLIGALAQAAEWLPEEPESHRYGVVPTVEDCFLYFLHADDAARFLSEFPDLVLANGGLSDTYGLYRDPPYKGRFGMADALNFATMSREELTKLRAKIDAAMASVGEREKRAARVAAEAAAKEHGFSLSEMTGSTGSGRGKGRGRKGASAASKPAGEARFRNPEDQNQTWSGRGRRPGWYNEALAAERPVEDLKAG